MLIPHCFFHCTSYRRGGGGGGCGNVDLLTTLRVPIKNTVCFHCSHLSQVQLSTRRVLPSLPSPTLHISRCQELANHYLGFNGWSVRIISLVPVSTTGLSLCGSSCHLRSDFSWLSPTTDTSGSDGMEEMCYRCEAGLEVRGWEGESEGVGVGRVELENPGN